MEYVFPSAFLAGLLTVLAPCTLTLLPVMLGGSVGGNKWRPLVVSLSLGFSVIIFTLLIKMGGAFLDFDGNGLADVSESTLRYFSGGMVAFIGFIMIFPEVWSWISTKIGFYNKSLELMEKSNQSGGLWGAVLLGFALGPVFNSCSPTYLLILAVILPFNFVDGFLTLLSYTTGLVVFLLLIGYGGRAIVGKLKGAANPRGWVKRSLGVLLLIIGIVLVFSWDKDIEAWLIMTGIDSGFGEVFNIECLIVDCDATQELFYPR